MAPKLRCCLHFYSTPLYKLWSYTTSHPRYSFSFNVRLRSDWRFKCSILWTLFPLGSWSKSSPTLYSKSSHQFSDLVTYMEVN